MAILSFCRVMFSVFCVSRGPRSLGSPLRNLRRLLAHRPRRGRINGLAGSRPLRIRIPSLPWPSANSARDSNLVQQIQSAYLGDAGPEAKDKFNQLLGGLQSGKLDLNGLRAEAKSAADQVRSVRKDLGDEEGSVIDGYLAILDSFLKETGTPASITSTPPPHRRSPKLACAGGMTHSAFSFVAAPKFFGA